MNVVGRVWAENFRPFLRDLAGVNGREMGEAELEAVEGLLEGSDAELGDWRGYPLPGREGVVTSLAYETGFDNVQIPFDADEGVGLRAEAAMQIMMRYSLRERRA